MRRGSLRWDEMMLAESSAQRGRWKRGATDAGASGRATPDAGAPIYPLVRLCRAAGLPEPLPEYKFHPLRKWRADYAWPIHRVMIEIDGGVWTQGRHTRGAGFIADMAKLNAAAMLGFRVLRYTPQQLGQAMADLRVMLA